MQIAKQLLEAKADINKATMKDETPLFIAVECGPIEIVKELLEAKTNSLLTTQNSINALELAQVMGQDGIVNLLQPYFLKSSVTSKNPSSYIPGLFAPQESQDHLSDTSFDASIDYQLKKT